jgi:DNA repair protein RecO (recombination protein O)
MEWQDEGFILHVQSLGERKQVVTLLTLTHGRCAGIFNSSSKTKAWVQCGGKVKARWGARLDTHLGFWALEPISQQVAFLMDAPGPLAALLSAVSLCQAALPERHAYPSLYVLFEAFLNDLFSEYWASSYALFEFSLLKELGYGLDLKTCAVTGTTEDLVAVSPRTGRAVCRTVAKPYEGRLLPLPVFICQENNKMMVHDQEILDALKLSGYFLERNLFGRKLPSARERLLGRFMNVRQG